jgi:hypothetical protein
MVRADSSLALGRLKAVRIIDPCHPIAAHLAKRGLGQDQSAVETNTDSSPMTWGKPGPCAAIIASLEIDRDSATLFAYEANARMPGRFASARRVGIFFSHELARTATEAGWSLLESAIQWASLRAKSFATVFQEEWQEIRQRRVVQYESLSKRSS